MASLIDCYPNVEPEQEGAGKQTGKKRMPTALIEWLTAALFRLTETKIGSAGPAQSLTAGLSRSTEAPNCLTALPHGLTKAKPNLTAPPPGSTLS